MGANEKSDYQAEFFPDAVSEEERKLFLRNNFQGAQISIVRLGFCMNNFLVLLTLRVRLTGLHS